MDVWGAGKDSITSGSCLPSKSKIGAAIDRDSPAREEIALYQETEALPDFHRLAHAAECLPQNVATGLGRNSFGHGGVDKTRSCLVTP